MKSPGHPTLLNSDGQKKPRSNRGMKTGAGNEIRTRDPNLGKVVLYQLSYSRKRAVIL